MGSIQAVTKYSPVLLPTNSFEEAELQRYETALRGENLLPDGFGPEEMLNRLRRRLSELQPVLSPELSVYFDTVQDRPVRGAGEIEAPPGPPQKSLV